MKKKNFNDWTKEELISEVQALKKQKTYGLVWEKDNTNEEFDYYINWDGMKNEEKFPNAKHKFPVLKEVKKNEIVTNKEDDYNILIEGDNYHSLATLNFTHNGKIDVIYIDPPYNTGGGEFKYNDKIVDINDTYRHSKWLSFMEKRLILAKNLLSPEGFIFISIDDNEQSQLKILCDEIFGGSNFVGNLIVQTNRGGRDYLQIAKTHEYLLCYSRSNKGILNELKKKVEFKLKDSNGGYEKRELRNRNPKFNRKNRPNLFYTIYINSKIEDENGCCPISLIKSKQFCIGAIPQNSKREDGCWRWGKPLLEKNISLNDPYKSNVVAKQKKDGNWNVYEKSRKFTTKAKSIWDETEVRTERGTIVLREIFGKSMFDHPKPVELIMKILSLSTNKNSVALDFFAGSGTTGQAVMELNKLDEGSRRFILCTNNEGNICSEVCYPRIKKVIGGYGGNKGIDTNLKYFQTDFVNNSSSDANKQKIVKKSTEMICLKENAFQKVKEGDDWKIFKNKNKYLGIVFDEDATEDFIKEVEKIDGNFNVYAFSLDESVPEKDFKKVKDKVKLCPIPEAILHVYRRIFK